MRTHTVSVRVTCTRPPILLQSMVRTSTCAHTFYFILSMAIRYQKQNGGVKCAQNKPYSIPEATAFLQVHQHVLLPQTNFLTLLNARPLKVNNSGFDLSPVDMVLFNDLKKGKDELKRPTKAFRKREKPDFAFLFNFKRPRGQIPHSGQIFETLT